MALKLDLLKLLIPIKKLGRIKLGYEDAMCVQFAQHLRELTFNDNLPYVWFHVPNQIGAYRPIFGLKQSWMGRIAGIPDYVFLGNRSFVIEFKSPKGKLSPAQKIVQEWCMKNSIDFHIAKTVSEAIQIVQDHITSDKGEKTLTNNNPLDWGPY